MSTADDRMDALVGRLLAAGVTISVTLIVAGLAWHRLATGSATVDARLGGSDVLRLLADDLRAVASNDLRPRLLLSLGIAVLLCTPYLRVLASVVYFAVIARNWKYTVFTTFVWIVLTYSLVMQ